MPASGREEGLEGDFVVKQVLRTTILPRVVRTARSPCRPYAPAPACQSPAGHTLGSSPGPSLLMRGRARARDPEKSHSASMASRAR